MVCHHADGELEMARKGGERSEEVRSWDRECSGKWQGWKRCSAAESVKSSKSELGSCQMSLDLKVKKEKKERECSLLFVHERST